MIMAIAIPSMIHTPFVKAVFPVWSLALASVLLVLGLLDEPTLGLLLGGLLLGGLLLGGLLLGGLLLGGLLVMMIFSWSLSTGVKPTAIDEEFFRYAEYQTSTTTLM
jgi:hypothetical protein